MLGQLDARPHVGDDDPNVEVEGRLDLHQTLRAAGPLGGSGVRVSTRRTERQLP